MKRTEPMVIRDILDSIVERSELRTRALEHRAAIEWEAVVGRGIAGITAGTSVERGVMTVALRSASMRQELSMRRSLLTRAINERLGQEIVKDIRFIAPKN